MITHVESAAAEEMDRNLIFIAGATGYIGGRLLMVLEGKGYRVRCLARRPEYLRPRICQATEVVAGDVFAPETLDAALGGVDQAYYLVHSMGSPESFEKQDRIAARNFAASARRAGVRRIIYLGGLGSGDALSPHLRSRQESATSCATPEYQSSNCALLSLSAQVAFPLR
jgi:uncharacterized protein YbjT (DUF2867 family)